MFLGDRKENLFKLGPLRLRCYGDVASSAQNWLELSPRDLWIFAKSSAAASVSTS